MKVVTLAAIMGTAGSAQAALVGHWEFEGDLTDSVGTADGVASGDAAVVGGVAVFDGVDDAITVPTTGLGSSTSMTVAIWSVADAGNVGAFIGSGANGYGNLFMRYLGSEPRMTGALYFDVGWDGLDSPNGYYGTDEIGVTVGEWHHMAITWDAGTQTAASYIDGVLTKSPLTMNWAFPGFHNDTLVMGENFADFAGSLDDLRLYDTALSAGEVAALIPEPSSLALAGLGFLPLLSRRRRRRAS